MRPVRLASLACAAGIAAALTGSVAGCGEADKASDSGAEPQEAAASPTSEAAEAGGLCEHLTFAALTEATGEPFTVAESGGSSEVTSCVIQTTAGSFPDITLTKAKTGADVETYESEIPPESSQNLKDLGDSAYSAVRKAVDGGGPVVEIGWLVDKQMYSLRYTTSEGVEKDDAKAVVDALVAIVRDVDASITAAGGDDEDKDKEKED
ncbi:MAG: hypothetical protein ACRDXX_07825 [Stackebrandtia sp.]